jgi:uncharacterized protein YndB with AHSA1/START domain
MSEITDQISAVSRRVGTRVLEAGQARTVTVSQSYDVPLADLWDACSSADRIPRWFLPISGELAEGGKYQLEGNAGGTISRCDAPHGFDATWEYGGDVSWIEVRLTAESATRSRFQLEHIAHAGDERWLEFGPGAVGVGWETGLLGLARHLSSGASTNPAEGLAWMASADGREFMKSSSERWRAAAVEAGEDPAQAAAAAARTTAAYVPEVS